jgi:hypothetical protein
MAYTLSDDELAIVIRPKGYEDEWQGDVAIDLIISPESPVPKEVMAHIMNVATMMSAFLDVASEYPDVYELVEDHRNYMMGIDAEEEEESLDIQQDGNVYTLNRWTKTRGNA